MTGPPFGTMLKSEGLPERSGGPFQLYFRRISGGLETFPVSTEACLRRNRIFR